MHITVGLATQKRWSVRNIAGPFVSTKNSKLVTWGLYLERIDVSGSKVLLAGQQTKNPETESVIFRYDTINISLFTHIRTIHSNRRCVNFTLKCREIKRETKEKTKQNKNNLRRNVIENSKFRNSTAVTQGQSLAFGRNIWPYVQSFNFNRQHLNNNFHLI